MWPGCRRGPWARLHLLAQAMSQGHSPAAPSHLRASLPSCRGLSGRGLPCWLCPSAPALRDGSPAQEPVGCKRIWPFCSVSHVTEPRCCPWEQQPGVGGCLRGSLLLLWPVSRPFGGLLAWVAILTLSPAPEVSAWPPPTVQHQSAGLMRALALLAPRSGISLFSAMANRFYI